MASFDVCPDIIFEILTLTSLESLDTCKVICRGWRKIICQSNFMPTYCQRTKNLSGYYVQGVMANKNVSKFISISQSEKGSKHVIESLPEDMEILASSKQGILCCLRTTGRYLRYHVCKPSTKQWQILPNPKTRYPTSSVGLMVLRASPLRFKIFRISHACKRPPKHNHYRFEIFDSAIWAWKQAKDIILPDRVIFETSTAINANGSLYWLTSDHNILALDEDQESYATFPLPQSAICKNGCYKNKRLMEYQGRLACMVQESEQYLELWVVENPRNGSWKKEKTVSIDSSFHEKTGTSIPIGIYNADISFMKTYYKVIFYNSQDNSYDEVKLDDLMDPRECFPFRSDVEPIDLKGRC